MDWSATGAMMSGIGAIAAAIGTVFIIALTWRYVQIYEGLLQLNRETLDAMKESVQASRDMAEVMRHQLGIASADVVAKIEQQHEPFRHLLNRMIEGARRVRDCDIVDAFHGTNLGLRPDASWFLPNDYTRKLEIAKDLDGELHRILHDINDPPDGPLYLMQVAIGHAGHAIRPEYAQVPPEGHTAAAEVKRLADDAIKQLESALKFVNGRAARLAKVASSDAVPQAPPN